MVCKLFKSIYGPKKTSRQKHLKFLKDKIEFGFKENIVNLYTSRSVGPYSYFWFCMFMGFYLPSNDRGLVHESIRLRNMCTNLEIRGMGEVPYVSEIEIFCNISLQSLKLPPQSIH